jgi:hypothetical protein
LSLHVLKKQAPGKKRSESLTARENTGKLKLVILFTSKGDLPVLSPDISRDRVPAGKVASSRACDRHQFR